jgi:hypothetical protein
MAESTELFHELSFLRTQRLIFVATDKNVNMRKLQELPGAIFVDERGPLDDVIRVAARKMLVGGPQ